MITKLKALKSIVEQTEHKIGLNTINELITEVMVQENFFKQLRDGGRIVSSNRCTVLEISEADACGRMIVDEDSFGYVFINK